VKLGVDAKKSVSELFVSTNIASIADNTVIDNYDYTPIDDEQGFQTITKNMYHVNIGLKHQLTPAISIYHAFGHLEKNDFLIYRDATGITESDSPVKLNQYYLSLNYAFMYGMSVSGGFHYINNRIPYTSVVGLGANQTTQINYTNDNDVVGFLSLQKSIGLFDASICLSYANLNGENQFQKDISISYFPFGNLNLYVNYTFTHHTAINSQSNENSLIHQGSIGFKVTKWLWLEGFTAQGVMHNFSSANASIVNNSLYPAKQVYSGRLIFPMVKKPFKLWLNFSNWQSESAYKINDSNIRTNQILSNYYSFSGGIIWNF